MLNIQKLSFSYADQLILNQVNLRAEPGEITAVIGPNAAGKSTLLKCIGGLLPFKGNVSLNGRDLSAIRQNELAGYIGYLPQDCHCRAVLNVLEVVLLGRVHSLSYRIGDNDLHMASLALRQVGLESLAARSIAELSGGQRQMVFLAQVLVREPPFLLLDEPTSCLDLHRQFGVLDLLARLTAAKKLTTVTTLHHLDLAARYAAQLIVVKDGRVYAAGPPEAVLTADMLQEVYHVRAEIHHDQEGFLHVIPLGAENERRC